MAKNVYQFVDVERIDPPKKPIMVRKHEFAEIYQPLSPVSYTHLTLPTTPYV